MANVVNNIVKMEWEKSGWIQRKGKGGADGVFILASKEFDSTTKGKVTVFFNADTAFIWASEPHTADEDLWNCAELKGWLADNLDGSFPDNWEECVAIIPFGEVSCNEDYLAEYGLTAYKDEIEARLNDVRPYGEEKFMGE